MNKAMKSCDQCARQHRIFHRGRCLRCHEQELVADRLVRVETNFLPASRYNKYLMDLFLVYIRKLKLRAGYACQAESLKVIFEQEKIKFVGTWQDIYILSEKYQIWDTNYRATGCAFKKIGRMLQGLGVIGHSEEEGRNLKQFEKNLQLFRSAQNLVWIDSFIGMLKKSNRSLRTQIIYLQYLKHLEAWLSRNQPTYEFKSITEKIAARYFNDLKSDFRSQNHIYSIFRNFHKFYRWGERGNYIDKNPFEGLNISRPIPKKRHLSEEDVKKLFRFVKDKRSDPEQALIIVLILVFGMTKEDLVHAQLSFLQDGRLRILIRKKKKTVGGKGISRGHVLELPMIPQWIFELQLSYAKWWKKRLESVHQIYDRKPLLLPHNNLYAVSLDSTVLERRLKKATMEAIGWSVSSRLLRNTCGVINTRSNDASALTKLGWSSKYSFDYVWLQREIVGPPQLDK